MNKNNTCCFIGHRQSTYSKLFIEKITCLIEGLIVDKQVSTFIFGSKSNFDTLCLNIVSTLKNKYPYISKICYLCSHEEAFLEEQRESFSAIYSIVIKKNLLTFDKKIYVETAYGKMAYIKRNQKMIDDSNFCVFYYDENQYSENKDISIPKSGTHLAFLYAKSKNKNIINVLK